jgi:hypothetical protein
MVNSLDKVTLEETRGDGHGFPTIPAIQVFLAAEERRKGTEGRVYQGTALACLELITR